MTTVYDVILDLARICGYVRSSTATSAGSTTTTVDSTRTEVADYWNDGIIFKPAASLTRRVTDWALSGTTFTHDAFPTSGIGSGNTYYVSDGQFPRDVLYVAINQALAEMRLPEYDDSSLTTVGDQRTYTLPVAVYDLLQLDIATSISEPYDYVPWASGWWVQDGILYFRAGSQPGETGYKMRLGYLSSYIGLDSTTPITSVDEDDDVIDSRIEKQRLIWMAAVYAWRWRIGMTRGNDAVAIQHMNEASQKAELMKRVYPLPRMIPYPRLPLMEV